MAHSFVASKLWAQRSVYWTSYFGPQAAARLITLPFIQRIEWENIEIGERYGPFDLTMIPIWRGGSLSWIAASVHGDPLDVWPGARAGFGNCSISEIAVDDGGVGTPGPWNQVDHITTG